MLVPKLSYSLLKQAGGVRSQLNMRITEPSFCKSALDSLHFASAERLPTEVKKDFWRTISHSAFGGKRAGWLRKAWGFCQYPLVLAYKGVQWLLGKRSGFKDWHPLYRKSRQTVFAAIQKLNTQVPPDLRYPFTWSELEQAGIHKNHLLKTHQSLQGLADLQVSKNWFETAVGLEKYLSANGKNNGQSCANISFTHAQKLATGAPMKRKHLAEAQVTLDPAGEKLILDLPGYKQAQGIEREKLAVQGEKKLLAQFGVRDQVRAVESMDEIEAVLSKAKNGTQLMIFDQLGDNGHVTLAVKLKGQIYHIDNWAEKSALVSPLSAWAQHKKPERLWYGVLKTQAHPVLAQGKTVEEFAKQAAPQPTKGVWDKIAAWWPQ